MIVIELWDFTRPSWKAPKRMPSNSECLIFSRCLKLYRRLVHCKHDRIHHFLRVFLKGLHSPLSKCFQWFLFLKDVENQCNLFLGNVYLTSATLRGQKRNKAPDVLKWWNVGTICAQCRGKRLGIKLQTHHRTPGQAKTLTLELSEPVYLLLVFICQGWCEAFFLFWL